MVFALVVFRTRTINGLYVLLEVLRTLADVDDAFVVCVVFNFNVVGTKVDGTVFDLFDGVFVGRVDIVVVLVIFGNEIVVFGIFKVDQIFDVDFVNNFTAAAVVVGFVEVIVVFTVVIVGFLGVIVGFVGVGGGFVEVVVGLVEVVVGFVEVVVSLVELVVGLVEVVLIVVDVESVGTAVDVEIVVELDVVVGVTSFFVVA